MNDGRIFTLESCVGCNLCIQSCPCNEANIVEIKGGARKVYVDSTKCITCGECLRVCTHGARNYKDDTSRFLDDVKAGKDISLIVAPALRCNITEWQRLLGYLKSIGVNRVFDASYGADICTWGYLRYIQKKGAEGIIAQPCPSIVNYIEHYVPELLSRLSPVQSPVICAAVYMKKYKNISGSYAFLSPCVAKGDEFDDPNTNGLIKYNITFKKLLEALEELNIDYRKSTPAEYDNPPHGLGAFFPMAGGLKINIEQHIKDKWIFKIEGQPRAASFLHEYVNERVDSPFLVDILSCGGGCNSGSGACEHIEYAIDKSMHKLKKNETDISVFDKELELDDFLRKYTPKKIMPIFVDRHEIENAFLALHKPSHEYRVTDCRACGYSTCQEMAVAVAKEINHVHNCVDYLRRTHMAQLNIRIDDTLKEEGEILF
ncbi:MAG: 4Fe-4S dicluster domain-containing protein [Defluviitaleaceae bacterium]|nr:4Fe-4S dicluster domain-containing protein [Defluviitaleaceae bacterium]